MRIFITGGCKNGKSTLAQELAVRQKKGDRPLYYIATMEPVDQEDRLRIKRHIKDREGLGFLTLEQPRQIADILKKSNHFGSYLLDSTTALLANEMFSSEGTDQNAILRISKEYMEILEQVDDLVIVSDYIYSDAGRFGEDTELYRKNLAFLDRLCAAQCDVVIEVCYGNRIVHKGEEKLETIG